MLLLLGWFVLWSHNMDSISWVRSASGNVFFMSSLIIILDATLADHLRFYMKMWANIKQCNVRTNLSRLSFQDGWSREKICNPCLVLQLPPRANPHPRTPGNHCWKNVMKKKRKNTWWLWGFCQWMHVEVSRPDPRFSRHLLQEAAKPSKSPVFFSLFVFFPPLSHLWLHPNIVVDIARHLWQIMKIRNKYLLCFFQHRCFHWMRVQKFLSRHKTPARHQYEEMFSI